MLSGKSWDIEKLQFMLEMERSPESERMYGCGMGNRDSQAFFYSSHLQSLVRISQYLTKSYDNRQGNLENGLQREEKEKI